MVGQGCPKIWRPGGAPRTRKVVGVAIGAALLLVMATTAPVHAVEATLRIEWGGAMSQWKGTIAIHGGTLSNLRPLGQDPDEPGSMWIERGMIQVRQPSGRVYDGLDVTVRAEENARLTLQLGPLVGKEVGQLIEIPLRDVLRERYTTRLDPAGNRIVIRRAPGDNLRVRLSRDSLVFTPGEKFSFRLQPDVPGAEPGSTIQIKVQLTAARDTKSLWSGVYPFKVPAVGEAVPDIAIDVPPLDAEGVFDLSIAVHPQGFAQRFVPAKPLAERKVQFVVLASQVAPVPLDHGSTWVRSLEIDSAKSKWWERLPTWSQWQRIPGVPDGPLSSGDTEFWKHPLATFVRLAPNKNRAAASWQAYRLSVKRPGTPHLLEVEYPSDVAQHLGISIVEPNAAGMATSTGQDSGVYVSEQFVEQAPKMMRHRLIFWPKTKAPLLLLVNRRPDVPALFGKIFLSAGPDRLPRALPAGHNIDERLLAAYFDRPSLTENFSATEVLDTAAGQSLDDWQTFYQAGVRLVDYLNHVGYNGLMVAVLADGSTIYPSRLLQPTPLYDTGVWASNARDPVRKDVLELLLRLFDRDGLKLVPALGFTTPLPALETMRRKSSAVTTGIEWVDASGKTWLEQNRPDRGLAPYYNLLNEQVQEAVLDVVREVLARYAGHTSFQGLALQLSANGYAQLLGPEWGLDDDTIGRFGRDTGVTVPGEGPDRFRQRAEFLLGRDQRKQREAWLTWRAGVIAKFHQRIAEEIAQARPAAKLYLATAQMFDSPEFKHLLQPKLPRRTNLHQMMRRVGIQTELYHDHPGIVLLRPQYISPPAPLSVQAIDIEINAAIESDRTLLAAPSPGSLLFHRAQRLRLPTFDAKSPFEKQYPYTELVAQPLPSGAANRRRFVHDLAKVDSLAIFDGGYLLPRGQENALRPLIRVYRQLPATGFTTISSSRQPITVRSLSRVNETLIYLVNDAPWPVEVMLPLEASADCLITRLGESMHVRPLDQGKDGPHWKVSMQPYDLVAARLNEPGVRAKQPRVQVSAAVYDALDRRVDELAARARALPGQLLLDVLQNPGFELPDDGRAIPGWKLVRALPGVDAQIDGAMFHSNPQMGFAGRQSVRLSSRQGTALLRSEPFPVPKSGRVAVFVWLRTNPAAAQSPLHLGLEGLHGSRNYYRPAILNRGADPQHQLQREWKQYVFRADDLAIKGLDEIRLRFDLMGPGEVWIDDVQLYDNLQFDSNEEIELSKIIFSADRAHKDGELGDCLRLLEGYWPRFLVENVPMPAGPIARSAQHPPRPKPIPAQPKEKPGMIDRMKGLVPKFLRF